MNTLDDLRSTLDRHASGLPDAALGGRAAAVRGRVRVVRRRRQAGVGGVAAAVVAAVALATSLGGRPAPVADRTLAGHVAPYTMRSLGYTYTFTQARQGAGSVRLRVPASYRPVLLTWATSGADDRVTLRGVEEGPRTVTADDFGDFVIVPPGRAGTVTVTGHGTVALAAYHLSGAAPGDTRDGVTFREDVAGARLLGDAIGRPGQAEVGFHLSTGGGPLAVSTLCAHGPADAWLHVAIPSGQLLFGGQCDDSLFDPAGSGGITTSLGADEARSTRLRMWVTHGERGPRVTDPDLRIAVGAYAAAPAVSRLAGHPVTAQREYDGHLWRLVDTKAGAPGERELVTGRYDGQETLVVMSWTRTGPGAIETLEDGRPGAGSFSAGSGSGSTTTTIPATGGTTGLRASARALRPDLRLGLARYVRVD